MMAKRVGDTGTASREGVLEELEQLASKDSGEHTHRHEKTGTGGDPGVASGVEPAPGDDAVEVWVKAQGLGPGVKHCDRARDRSESAVAYVMERPEGGLEEQLVAGAPFRQKEGVQGRWHGEDK